MLANPDVRGDGLPPTTLTKARREKPRNDVQATAAVALPRGGQSNIESRDSKTGPSAAKVAPGSSRINNFDALRLLAATAVVVSHSFALAGQEQPAIGAMDVGTIAVVVFFGISGFLITQSWATDPNLWRFAAKRGLRIMPALVVVVLITTVVLGPLVSSLPPSEYFRESGTWAYLVQNVLLVTTDNLPGVFTNLPYERQVNGVLWTLQSEVIAYVGLAVVGVLGGLRTRWIPIVVTGALIVAPHGLVPWDNGLFMSQAFGVGACLYLLRAMVPWHPGLVVAGLLAWAASPEGLQLLLAVTVIPYAAIFVAYRGPAALRRLTAKGDFSYGVYLIGWPVGQVVVLLLGESVTTGIVIAVSLPITYVLAIASWRFLERPALGLKRYLHQERRGLAKPPVREAAEPI